MIIRLAPGGVLLADKEWLADHHHLSQETIRKRLRSIEFDPETRRALYDVERAQDALRHAKARSRE